MARPRTPIGTFGEIESTALPSGGFRARTRFRDHDGQLRRIEATGTTRKLAEHRLKESIARRADHGTSFDDLTPDSPSIETRAQQLVQAAITSNESWVGRCGAMPADSSARAEWAKAVGTVAAYRDRYGISSRSALGDLPPNDAQKLDAARAERAVRRAQAIGDEVSTPDGHRPTVPERRLIN